MKVFSIHRRPRAVELRLSRGCLHLRKPRGCRLRPYFVIRLRPYFVIRSRSYFVIRSRPYFVIRSRSHFVVRSRFV